MEITNGITNAATTGITNGITNGILVRMEITNAGSLVSAALGSCSTFTNGITNPATTGITNGIIYTDAVYGDY
jgi:hypothetical protein